MSLPPFSSMLGRYAAVLLIMTVLGALFYLAAFGLPGKRVDAGQFVDLQQGDKIHHGFRRAHAKGFCITGEWVSSGALAPFTQADLLASGRTPFNGRISIAGNNPSAPDLKAPVRSLAISLEGADGQVWRTAMNTPPVMAVRNPQDFYRQLQALGDGTIQAFFAAHPESAAFRAWASEYEPTGSFAAETYHSINAFYLVDEEGHRQAVRWRAQPHGLSEMPDVSTLEGEDALQNEFFHRLASGPVVFDLIFSFAQPSDDEADPTIPWPEDRQAHTAGQLMITDAQPQSSGQCNDINFDPLVLPTGIVPTADKILRARSAAYAESYRRRAYETWQHANEASH
ncbi:catalase [Marinimicrobium koreense]|uniref:Catalase-related peroxidase n=1 Tax=Marinimicrobium koreense TaxID=306545 RepID=A0A3N1PB00_9GAMM|nr:catalase family peroxidase [Marinimicrobium koreense]ROQ21826.1 catalase [Marinimicrobium koreense]